MVGYFQSYCCGSSAGNTKFDAPPSNSEGSTVMKECDAVFDIVSKLTAVDRKSL